MESSKIIFVQNLQRHSFLAKNLSEESLLKSHVIQCENWKSLNYLELKAHIIILPPELDLRMQTHITRKIRAKNELAPIIAIRQENAFICKAPLFEAGIDDYISIPFDNKELVFRIKNLIRRTQPLKADSPVEFTIADISFDYTNLFVKFKNGSSTKVTQLQADLLNFLFQHPDALLERGEILFHVWGKNCRFLGRSMDVINTSIRKILAGSNAVWLETVHGKGFILHTKKSKQCKTA